MRHHGELAVLDEPSEVDTVPSAEAERETFTWHGEPFEVPTTMGSGSSLRFAWRLKEADGKLQRASQKARKALTGEGRAEAAQLDAEANLDASAAAYDLLRAVLGEDQLSRVIDTADREGVDLFGLLALCHRVQELIAGRPTQPSSDSSAGRQTSGDGSTDGGSGEPAGPAPSRVVELTPRERQRAMHEQMMAPPEAALASYG